MMSNPFLAADKEIIADIYTSTETMDNLTILCDDFGSRFGGTEGERQAVEFMKTKLRDYGLTNVHLEPFEYVGWRRGEAHLEVISPLRKTISCITLPHSPPADLEGILVDMGSGAPEDFDSRADEITGKIVLTNSEVRPKSAKRWIHRGEKFGRSLLAGASGFIFVNHYPGYGPATGGIGRNNEAPIPGVSISLEDGAFLQRLMKRKGEVRIHLSSTDECFTMTSWNLIGDLPGEKAQKQIVMLGCHYDGHDISQGAQDPASGAVVVLEAARVLAKYGSNLHHTLRFALWGVEEIGLIGSRNYVSKHQAQLEQIRFYLNLDSAGAVTHKGIALNEWPELEPLLNRWREEMALEFGVKQSVNAHSDHFPFMMAGVPTGGMESVGNEQHEGRGYGHTMHDTVDKVSLASLREASALVARLALRMAAEDTWPVERRTEEAVKAILDTPAYREESSFRKRLAEFYDSLTRPS